MKELVNFEKKGKARRCNIYEKTESNVDIYLGDFADFQSDARIPAMSEFWS